MKQKKKDKRLEARQRDFEAIKTSGDATTKQRIDSGGMHRPGSMKK